MADLSASRDAFKARVSLGAQQPNAPGGQRRKRPKSHGEAGGGTLSAPRAPLHSRDDASGGGDEPLRELGFLAVSELKGLFPALRKKALAHVGGAASSQALVAEALESALPAGHAPPLKRGLLAQLEEAPEAAPGAGVLARRAGLDGFGGGGGGGAPPTLATLDRLFAHTEAPQAKPIVVAVQGVYEDSAMRKIHETVDEYGGSVVEFNDYDGDGRDKLETDGNGE